MFYFVIFATLFFSLVVWRMNLNFMASDTVLSKNLLDGILHVRSFTHIGMAMPYIVFEQQQKSKLFSVTLCSMFRLYKLFGWQR